MKNKKTLMSYLFWVILFLAMLIVIETTINIKSSAKEPLTDEELSLLYSYKFDARIDTCLEVTQEEAELLMKVAVLENGDHDALAQAYVMSTILNRVKDENFPNTISEVVFQTVNGKPQFHTAKKIKSAKPNLNSHVALYLIESRQVESDALFFEAEWVEDSWASRNREYLFSYDGTRYYR